MKLISCLILLLIFAFLFLNSCQNRNSIPTTSGADFESIPIFLNQWGGFGTGRGQFDQIGGISLDGSGNIYVCDTSNNRIEKFDPGGNFLSQWGGPAIGSGPGQFNSPNAIACFSGKIYVADSGNNRIQIFDNNGNSVTYFGSAGYGLGQLNNPEGVAVDSYGDIYVVDTGNNRVQEFFAILSTTPIAWGGLGSGPGNFLSPTGIVLDVSNYVYVADTQNNRIEKFTPTGGFQKQWGTYGNGVGQFRSPDGLTFDSSGNLWVSDSANARIQVFDTSGDYISQWNGGGDDVGQFQIPWSLGISSSPEYIYVADFGTNYVKRYGPPAAYDIFPNPVLPSQELTISFNSASFVGYLIQITDLNNNVVFSDQGEAVMGTNAIQWNCTLNGSRVQAGIYLLNFSLGHSEIEQKVSIAD